MTHVSFDHQHGRLSITLARSDVVSRYIEEGEIWVRAASDQTLPPTPYSLIDWLIPAIADAAKAKTWRLDSSARQMRTDGRSLIYANDRGHRGLEALLRSQPTDVLFDYLYSYDVVTLPQPQWGLRLQGDFFTPVHDHWNMPPFAYDFKLKKTQANHHISFRNSTVLPLSSADRDRLVELARSCRCPTHALAAHASLYGCALQYSCLFCGKAYICSCFAPAKEWITEEVSHYSKSHRDPDALNPAWTYREKTCHLCRGETPARTFMSPTYGSRVMVSYAPWIYLDAFISKGSKPNTDPRSPDIRAAEDRFRERIGVPKIGEGWVNETLLYNFVRQWAGSRFEVLHHARPVHLSGQEYDVFIPDLALAIEYDGVQHHRPVKVFGGDIGFERTKERDRRKNEKAKAAGISIIRVVPGYSEANLLVELEKHEAARQQTK